MQFALPAAPRAVLVEFEDQVIEKLNLCAGLDSLMQSAREDEMAHWLEQHGIPTVSKFTAALGRGECGERRVGASDWTVQCAGTS